MAQTFEEKLNKISENVLLCEKLSEHTTFRIGGPCRALVNVKNEREIAEVTALCKECGVKYMVLGRGSNVLFPDKGYDGVVIAVGKAMSNITKDADVIRAQAGASLFQLSAFALENRITGFEELSGIPGYIGGAVRMNAGAYGREIKDVLLSVTFSEDGKVKKVSAEDAGLSYRHSIFCEAPDKIILEAEFKADQIKEKSEIQTLMNELSAKRREKQPLEFPSAGSTFKRPEGYFASKLIDECGLKGFRIGDAEVSPKHAGFVVNVGRATHEDVLGVIEHVKKTVFEKTKVILEPEIVLV